MIAYLIGGPQDMVKTLVPDNEFKSRYLKFAHAKVYAPGVDGVPHLLGVDTPIPDNVVVEELLYVKVYESWRGRGREQYAVFAYSPDGLVP